VEGRANDSFYSEDGKRIYLFDIERIVLEDEMVAQCKAVAVQINGKFKPILHVVLQKNGVTDAKTVIPRIYKKLSEQLPQNAVPVAYKLRQTLPVHPNGKRNVEALKAENDGFVDLMGNGWRVR
jgi:long-chain acyl-CoA synthetase